MTCPNGSFRSRVRELLLSRGVDAAIIDGPQGSQLASAQVLGSLVLLEVLFLVEEHLGRDLGEEELTNENFDSLDAICALAGEGQAA